MATASPQTSPTHADLGAYTVEELIELHQGIRRYRLTLPRDALRQGRDPMRVGEAGRILDELTGRGVKAAVIYRPLAH